MSNTIELCKALVERESITPHDAGCQRLLIKRLEAIGFNCQTLQFEDVTNLWAVHGSQKPKLCYVGHTDVVPTGPHEQWKSPPFVPTIRDGNLYGRGIADMKGSVACIIVALETIAQEHGLKALNGMSLLITSDEEGAAQHGVKAALTHLSAEQLPEYCLVGEPSCDSTFGDTIKVGRRGSLHGTLTLYGKQGHVAYPHKANNPIHTAGRAISALTSLDWQDGNDHFPNTSLQISQVHAGTGALNVIPGEVSLNFNLRFSPNSTPKLIDAKVREALQPFDFLLEWHIGAEPFYTAPDENPMVAPLVNAIQNITGQTPTLATTGGTSDGRFMAAYSVPVVEFGPINESIHQVNEHVGVQELEDLTAVYQQFVHEFLSD